MKNVEANEEEANMEKSTVFLTINPNTVCDNDEEELFRAVIGYITDHLDRVLLLRQGDVAYGYEELEPLLVGDMKVSVKYEVGSRFHRSHMHMKIEAVLNGRGNKVQFDLAKIRGYLKEQLGYTPHLDAKFVKDSVFDIERYIRK